MRLPIHPSVLATLLGAFSTPDLLATETWTDQSTPSTLDLHGVAVARLETLDGPRTSFFIAGQGGVWRGDQPLAAEWELVMNEPGEYQGITVSSINSLRSVEVVGDSGKVARSTDGTNWTTGTIAGAANFTAVAANNDLIVAVDDEGKIFTGGTVLGLNVRHTEAGVTWNGVAFGNNTWVVVGSDATVATSTDGFNWQVFPGALSDGLTPVDFHDVAFGPGFYQGGFFMAVGEEGFISTSADGSNWTERQSGQSSGRLLRAAVFAARHAACIAMGDGGLGNISHNATGSFTTINQVFPQGMNDLAYGFGYTVAVGDNGKVFSSVTRLNPTSTALSDPPAGQINVSDAGGNFTINLANTSTDAKWRAEVLGTSGNPDATNFISVSPTSGTGTSPSSFTITVEPFGTVANRSGLVLLNDIEIPIVQAGDGDPQPVSSLTADPLTDKAIQLTWPPAIGATDYEIQRRPGGGSEFAKIATVPGAANPIGDLDYIDQAGLLPNSEYCYQVVALNLVEQRGTTFHGGGCPFGCGAATTTFIVEFGRAQEASPVVCTTTLLTGAGGFFGELIGFEAIELHWNPVPGAASYVLERNVSGTFATIANPAGSDTSFLDTTIPSIDYGQSFIYRLTASGGVPRTTTVRTTVEPPTAFVNAVDVPDISVLVGAFDLTWSRRDFLNTEVQTRVEPGGDWINIDLSDSLVDQIAVNTAGGIRTETWRFTQPAITRSFRVRTRGNQGTPNPPSEWIVCGPASTPPPPNPTSFSVTSRTSTTASFSWTDVSDEQGYELTVRPSSAIDGSQDIVVFAAADETDATVTGFFPGTSYDAFLVAFGAEGVNATSRSTMGASSASLTFSTLPRGPMTVTATAHTATFVTVAWSQVTGATGYEIWRREYVSPFGWTDYAVFGSIGSGSLGVSDFTVEGDHSYRYRVRAEFGTDFTDFRESDVVGTPIGAPDLVSAKALDASSIALDWTDSNNAVQGYTVERASSSGGPWSGVKTIIDFFGSPATETTDTGLSADREYFYRVKAFGLFGNVSAPSNVRSATTLSRLTIGSLSPTSVTLTWDPVSGITQYEFERATLGSSGPYFAAGSAPFDAVKFTDSDRSPSSVYYYRMHPALKGGAFAPYTEIRTVATPPLAPTGLSGNLSFSSAAQVKLIWSAGSTSDEYFIQWRPGSGSYTTVGTNTSPSFIHTSPHPGQNDYRVRAGFMGSLSAYATTSINWVVTPEEQWRFDNFGTTENIGDAADVADPDEDGAPNNHERAAGTGPNDSNDFLHITRLEFDFPNLNLFWDGVAGVTYNVSESTNLIDFTALPSEQRTSSGGEESASTILSAPFKAFRVEVVQVIGD